MMSIASAAHVPPLFNTPVRWTLRVLSWLAFGITAYLAWHAVTGSSVAGCGFGGSNSCDAVLTSSWSKWMGVPVAVLGLACYATLAGLSVLLGLRDASVGRWINTAFLMVSILAAGASAWFIGLQILVIGRYCVFCIITDVCGVAIGVIAIASTIRWLIDTSYLRRRPSTAGLMALRTTLPGGPRTSAVASAPSLKLPTPSMVLAIGGAFSLLVALAAGQILNPSKTHSLEKGMLDQSIAMVGSSSRAATNGGAQPHVAMRIPSEDRPEDAAPVNREDAGAAEPNDSTNGADSTSDSSTSNGGTSDADGPNANSEADPTSPSPPDARERVVTFLEGKLTLDVYKHPLIGSPDAPHVMVEMISYDCPHCRKMHRTMERGLERYRKQLAVIVMPVPLEKGCNKLVTTAAGSHRGACATARMAIGVATIRPSAFTGFHHWLMSGDEDKAPTIEKVLPKAYNTVDRNRLRNFIRGDDVNKQIAGYVDLYSRLQSSHSRGKQFGLPIQILGDHVLSGSAENEEDVYSAWEKHLGVKALNSPVR